MASNSSFANEVDGIVDAVIDENEGIDPVARQHYLDEFRSQFPELADLIERGREIELKQSAAA